MGLPLLLSVATIVTLSISLGKAAHPHRGSHLGVATIVTLSISLGCTHEQSSVAIPAPTSTLAPTSTSAEDSPTQPGLGLPPTTTLLEGTPTTGKPTHEQPSPQHSVFPDITTSNTVSISRDGKCRTHQPAKNGSNLPCWTLQIIERIPHDPDAFTQGLEVSDRIIYESTGLYGQSSLRKIDASTGVVEETIALSDDLFGEGLTLVDDKLIQLTWKSGRALYYDLGTLQQLDEYHYQSEGWGLCRMNDVLYMSDGSNQLHQRDVNTFELITKVTVTTPLAGIDVDNLNELECVEELVIANVWQESYLLVIDVDTEADQAEVVAMIDASMLLEDIRLNATDLSTPIDVLNGVAATRDGSGTLWLTGKLWPYLYRVRIIPTG